MELVAGPLCEDSASRRKQLGDLRHSIEKGAVEVQIKLICAALLCHSGGPMSRDKGPCTKGACRFHGMVPNSIVEGAVPAESKFICAALQCLLGGPMSRDMGPRTKEACRFHATVPNKPLEVLVHSMVEGAVEAERKFFCAALQCHLGGPMSIRRLPPCSTALWRALPCSTPLRGLPPCSPSPCSRPPSATQA